MEVKAILGSASEMQNINAKRVQNAKQSSLNNVKTVSSNPKPARMLSELHPLAGELTYKYTGGIFCFSSETLLTWFKWYLLL